MAKQKLTPWFPASVKPARKGAYQVGYRTGSVVIPFAFPFHYFDGREWIGDASSAPMVLAGVRDSIRNAYGECYWRGLAENPNA